MFAQWNRDGVALKTIIFLFLCLLLLVPKCIIADDDLPPGLAPDLKTLMEEAAADMQAKRYAEAESLFQQVADSDPANIDVLQSLGNSQWAQDKKALAVRNYRRYLKEKPDDAKLKAWMIRMGYIDSETDEAAPPLPVESPSVSQVKKPTVPLEPWERSRIVFSALASYGFLTPQESYYVGSGNYSDYWGQGTESISEYEAGLEESWEGKWLGAGLGFNYEWHQIQSTYTYTWGLENIHDSFNNSYWVWNIPIFFELFYPFRYVKPGIQLGPDVFGYVGSGQGYYGSDQGYWGFRSR